MKSPQLVAFDGTPLEHGCGIRAGILDVETDGQLRVGDGRMLSRARFDELVARGYVTRLPEPRSVDSSEGIVVYRWRDPALITVEHRDVQWTPCGDVDIAWLTPTLAENVLASHARQKSLLGTVALHEKRWSDAVARAREGLMAVPKRRSSPLSAELYAILYAAALTDAAVLQRIEREMEVLLEAARATQAQTRGRALRAREHRSLAPMPVERKLRPGTTSPPRRVA